MLILENVSTDSQSCSSWPGAIPPERERPDKIRAAAIDGCGAKGGSDGDTPPGLYVLQDGAGARRIGPTFNVEALINEPIEHCSRHDVGTISYQRARPRDRNVVRLVVNFVLGGRLGFVAVPFRPGLERRLRGIPNVAWRV